MKRSKITLEAFEKHFFKDHAFKNFKDYFEATWRLFQLRGFNGFIWQIGYKRGERVKALISENPVSNFKSFACVSINEEINKWAEIHGVVPFILNFYGWANITEWTQCMGCGKEDWYWVERCCSGSECGCMGKPIEPVICSPQCYNKVMGYGLMEDLPPWIVGPRHEVMKDYEVAAIINDNITLQILKTF